MSYKIVIIDDNIPFAKMLGSTIEWSLLGCTVAATAHNGLDGKRTIVDIKPDIILADINMPGMDGLRMIELVKETVPRAKIIFISAYDTFDFAARAIRLGAFDYVLKPLDKEKLVNTVQKAIRSLEKQSRTEPVARESVTADSLDRVMAITLLLNNLLLPEEEIRKTLERASIVFSSFFAVSIESEKMYEEDILTSYLNNEKISDSAIAVCLYYSNRLIIFFFLNDIYDEVPKEFLETALLDLDNSGMDIKHVVVSGIYNSFNDIFTAYSCVAEFSGIAKASSDNISIHYVDNYYERCAENYAKIFQLIDLTCEKLYKQMESVSTVVNSFISELYTLAHQDMVSIKFFLINFCMIFIKRYKQGSFSGFSGFVDETIRKIKKAADINMFLDTLTKFVLYVLGFNHQEETDTSILVRDILFYIDSHAPEHITLEKLSEIFYISPAYISTLIKKFTGKNFTYYLAKAKMSLGKQILLDPRYRVEEVACAVGYKNYTTFYKAFMKYEGISPSQYRNRNEA